MSETVARPHLGELADAAKLPRDLAYRPSKWGREFHSLTTHEALGAGSAGPGKTFVLIHEPLPQIYIEHQRCLGNHEHPLGWGDSVGCALFLRRELGGLDQVIARTKRVFPKIDPAAKWHEQDKKWTFSSGYKYQFGHCANSGDWDKYFGDEFTLIMYDELVTFDFEQYENINSRLRTSDPVLIKMLKIRAMSNPYYKREGNTAQVKDPHWVRRRFVDPAPEGRELLTSEHHNPLDNTIISKTRIYLPAKLTDNPDPAFVATYIANLVDKAPHIRNALINGDWYITADSFFGGLWNSRIHVVSASHIPNSWKRFRSLDWGFKTHGCIHWFAMDEEENLWTEREFYFINMLVPKVSEEVQRIEEDLGLWSGGRSLITGPADTQIWEERGDSGLTKAAEFAENGIMWVPANKKSRSRNAELLCTRLNSHQEGTTMPGIVFFSNCKMAIRTIPMLAPDADNPEEPRKGGEDHAYDSVSYGVSYASHGASGIPSVRRSTGWDSEDGDERERGSKDRGSYGYGERY